VALDRTIALDLIGAHPVAAARALERMREADVAALLATTESAHLASLLAALTPAAAASQLALLPLARSVEVLSRLGPELGAPLARALESERRRIVLEALDEEERTAFERLLHYPADTAGALMDPRVASFHESRLVRDALEAVRERWRHLRYYVFVLDDEHRLAGVLSLRELVSASADASLTSVMRRPVVSLSARASRGAILRHPGWRSFPQLPVVDEADRLLGVFRYRTYQSLQRDGAREEAPGPLGLALALGELFWLGASGVVRGIALEGRTSLEPSGGDEEPSP